MKILVIGPSWVGGMMMSQSLYRTLKARYPQAIIDVMAVIWKWKTVRSQKDTLTTTLQLR